ncbi:MAG: ABC transporter substrate-binding protein [Faecalibacterium sp.]
MHRLFAFVLVFALTLPLLSGCAGRGASSAPAELSSAVTSTAGPEDVSFTDALGRSVTLTRWERVVSLYGSFAETWVLAGGTLVGVTDDAVEERGLALGDGVALMGSVKAPSLEQVLAQSPDFVILSADTEGQLALDDALTEAGVPHAYYRVDSFDDYLAMLRQFCDLTGRDDLYEQYGTAQQERILQIREAVAALDGPRPTVLLLRAYSTGVKAKGRDIFAGEMLAELGADNLVEQYQSLLDDLSLEAIIAADPDDILVVTMGADESKAAAYLAEHLESNPAWSGLSAVQNGRYRFLPKELFHYKPNARWAESYDYLARLLYPELETDRKQ